MNRSVLASLTLVVLSTVSPLALAQGPVQAPGLSLDGLPQQTATVNIDKTSADLAGIPVAAPGLSLDGGQNQAIAVKNGDVNSGNTENRVMAPGLSLDGSDV